MEYTKRFLPWPATPLPGIALSASGLLALADLSTIANRTAITGTSTWLDMLVLAPGLHNQQRADTLSDLPNPLTQPLLTTPAHRPMTLTNAATIRYLVRLGSGDHPVTLRVGSPRTQSLRTTVSTASLRRVRESPRPSLVAPLLYFIALSLTVGAMAIMVLTRDWWGVGILSALMLARALNIWIIRGRTSTSGPVSAAAAATPGSPPPTPADTEPESWQVKIDGDKEICLQGLADDLEALTGGIWMRGKTAVEGYAEAAAKLIVYLVAAFSGNMHQTGDMVLLLLLLFSAGLLALSNSREDRFWMNGRSAVIIPGIGAVIDSRNPTEWGRTADGGGDEMKGTSGDATPGSMMTFNGMNLPSTYEFQGWNIRYDLKRSRNTTGSNQTKAKCLVFVHGTPWSSIVFKPIVEALLAKGSYKILVYDLPGYGQSQDYNPNSNETTSKADFPGDTSVKFQAKALAELLRHVALDGRGTNPTPAIIAHDIAGTIVLRAHLLHDCNFDTILMAESNCVLPWGDGFYKLARSEPQTFVKLPPKISEAVVRAVIQSACHDVKVLETGWEDALAQPWISSDGAEAGDRQRSFVRQIAQADDGDVAEMLEGEMYARVRCDVKIVWGEQDQWIPRARIEETIEKLGSRVKQTVFIPNAGHLVMLDQPERFAIEVFDWLIHYETPQCYIDI
ncbi:hypothetical protein ACLOAV_006284 [Pseudogymnoascus australis]